MGSGRLAGGGNSAGAKPATAARMYDYYLGGIHNFPADREAADAIIRMFPRTRMAAQVNRAFLRRAVTHLCQIGVTQFLDIGSGIPTEGNVHEIAQEADPQARVVYVDIDPVAVAESQEMLEGNEFAIAIQGDACHPLTILEHPQVRKQLDFDRPIAVLLVAVLHFVSDDHQARELVRQLLAGVPAGSYLVLSHLIDETTPDSANGDDLKRVHDLYHRQTATMLRMRTRAEVADFFQGLKLVDPGIVQVWHWNPGPDDEGPARDDPAYNATSGGIFGGVGMLADP
jgi:hypothetical protein